MISVSEVFGFDSDVKVPECECDDDLRSHIPPVDTAYRFDRAVTLAIIAGFEHNRRVLIRGLHGSGKSTHFEQVAARLGWPMVRVNLDGHISRLDLIGRDAVVLEDNKQVTRFQPGVLPWAIERPVALVFDELDAGRPEVMFIIQRLLEANGKFTLLDQNRVITPHSGFRLFATSNTAGLGDLTGLYYGTNTLSQAQLDRWNLVARLDYLDAGAEREIVLARVPQAQKLDEMIAVATMTRTGFEAGDVSTVMSPRTVIDWAINTQIFEDVEAAFKLSFLNKCDDAEMAVFGEYWQRAFGNELDTA